MKWKTPVFWLLVFTGLFFFFRSFNLYFYQRQEDMQLFIPEWEHIREMLSVPGGFCTIVGQALVQYYPNLPVALFINCSLLCAIGFLSYQFLQAIASRGYNLLLALVPVLALTKVHLRSDYVLDGTIGLFLMLLFLSVFLCIRKVRMRLLYGLGSTVAIYLLAGQLAALYSLLLVALTLFCRWEKGYYSLAALFLGLTLTYAGIRLAIYIPLTDGIYSERYQESQLQPDSYMYFVWIRFTILLLILFAVAYGMHFLPWKKRTGKILITGSTAFALFVFSGFCLPEPYDVQNHLMDKLSALERRQDWDAIIEMHQDQKMANPVSLNYLNMALAQKGILGDKLFHYEQSGPQSLLTTWNRTYFVSALLSDIHYNIGDISTSESYAMEGLTLAKRGGSPSMLQRLVKISLIRRDFVLAGKYIGLLSRLPNYRKWAQQYREYIDHFEKIGQDKELVAKSLPALASDNLLCLTDIDSLWMEHLSEPGVNRMALEYLGCSYLLAKEMEKFKSLLLHIAGIPEWQPLPIHFQEAALILAIDDASVLEKVSVYPEILEQCKQFQQAIRETDKDSNGLARLRKQYGDTFWFYYYCKKLG